jgi:outer membrane protein OmpU
MKTMKALLGTTALVGAGLVLGTPASLEAASISPGGALDITITGFSRFRASGGDIDNAQLNNNRSTGLDFTTDTEVHVVARAKHDGTGIEYGGTIEFEADEGSLNNVDENWLFVRGGFGEFRFGDEDGASDNSKVGGFTIAAGTGGIDGSIVDTIAVNVVGPSNSGDATKVRYYTPSFGGFSLGVSYTPNPTVGGVQATKNADPQDFVEGALVYNGSFDGVDVLASLVGGVCRIENFQDDDCWTIFGGAAVTLWGFSIGGGYGTEKVGGDNNVAVGGPNNDRDWWNAGVGASFGPVNMSLTYGQANPNDLVVNGNRIGDAYNVVLSADIGLMPGLVLAGDVGYFDNDTEGYNRADDPAGVGDNVGDNGVQAVARLGLSF